MAYEKQTWQTGETITAQKLNHMEDGIASGGSSDLFIISATQDPISEDITLDKTFAEINTAITNNQNIVMFTMSKLFGVISADPHAIKFNNCSTDTYNGQQSLNGTTITVDSDNNIGVTYEYFAIPQ